MFKLFKEHVSKTSILDDFTSYKSHQKLMQDKRAKQQQIQKQVDCLRLLRSGTVELPFLSQPVNNSRKLLTGSQSHLHCTKQCQLRGEGSYR
uniref:Uncharacterized protein n=1 Tax=Setaria viridis TaxID=4556 RepID=A0A4U6WSI4_SETVI|nr:hypothetical protein SEVIR_1G363700v2 [Setaria viridis]